MSDQVGSVSVEIRGDLGPLQADFLKARQATDQFASRTQATSATATRALQAVGVQGAGALNALRLAGDRAAESAALLTGPLGGVASRISILSHVTSGANLALLAGGVAFGAFAVGAKRAIQEAEKFEHLQRRTEAVLKATGHAAGLTAREIRGLADELDDTTLANPAEIEQASQLLLTFRSVAGDVFTDAIRLSADLAEVGFGTVTSAAVQLGKALESPTDGLAALRRVGVSFTATQKEQIKNFEETGRLVEAQKVVLQALKDQVGGAAAGSTGGLTGAIDDLGDAWDRLLRRLGDSGPFKEAAAGLARLTADAINAAGRIIAPSDSEKFDQVSEEIAALKDSLRQVRGTERYNAEAREAQRRLEYLEAERNRLGELIQQTESLRALDEQRAQEKGAAEQAEIAAERTAEIEKQLAPARLEAQKAEIDNQLRLNQAKLEAQAAQDEAYNEGRRASEIAVAQIDAEVAALEKKKRLVEQSSVDGTEAQIAKDAELAAINAEIAAKGYERQAAAIDQVAVAHSRAVKDATDFFNIAQRLAELYDGTEKSLREMAIQEKILNELQQQRLDANSEEGKALAERIRATEELNNALQDQIRLDQQLRGVREEIARLQVEDFAAQNFGTMSGGLTAQGNAYLKQQELLNEATRSGQTITSDMRREIDAVAGAYGRARAASDAFRQAQSAQIQFAQGAVDTTSNLIGSLATDIDNWKDHLLTAFGEILSSYIRMVGQMAMAQQSGGSGGGGGWLNALLAAFIGAAGSGIAGAATAGGSASDISRPGNTYEVDWKFSHDGGIVGQSGRRGPRTSAAALIGVPKYHRGIQGIGLPRLASDEVPTILQKGETVLPRGARRGMGGNTTIFNVTTPDADSFMRSERQFHRMGRRRIGVRGNA